MRACLRENPSEKCLRTQRIRKLKCSSTAGITKMGLYCTTTEKCIYKLLWYRWRVAQQARTPCVHTMLTCGLQKCDVTQNITRCKLLMYWPCKRSTSPANKKGFTKPVT